MCKDNILVASKAMLSTFYIFESNSHCELKTEKLCTSLQMFRVLLFAGQIRDNISSCRVWSINFVCLFCLWSVNVSENKIGVDFVGIIAWRCKKGKETHGAAVSQRKRSADISTHCRCIQIVRKCSEGPVFHHWFSFFLLSEMLD